MNIRSGGYAYWGTEDSVKDFISHYLKMRGFECPHFCASKDFSLMGLNICIDIDSMRLRQNEKRVYYLMFAKRTS
jgi:hypothetical protein